MFSPKYTITESMLRLIRRIDGLLAELQHAVLPGAIRSSLEWEARALSSFASTSIEGNPLPLTAVKRILKNRPENIRSTEREILNYNAALEFIEKLSAKKQTPLNHSLVCTIQEKVVAGLLPTSQCGSYRQDPVFVNDPRTRKTIYWPPDGKNVHPLMTDLLEFMEKKQETVDPLLLAGIIHRQFVIIHPFIDGNGRTARLLVTFVLSQFGLPLSKLFSFERYYNSNVTRYFEKVGLRGNYYDLLKNIDFMEWLEYFLEGILDELLRVQKRVEQYRLPHFRLERHHERILRYIQEHGSIRDLEYSRLTKRAKSSRILDFQKLLKLGLVERKGKGRATYYLLKEEA